MITFSNIIKLCLLSVIALALTWLVISRSFVAYFAKDRVQTALFLRSNDANALLKIVDKAINPAPQAKVTEAVKTNQLKKWTKQALLEAPLNARAFRLLGQLAGQDQPSDFSQKNMEISHKLSIRESVASYWLMQKSYQKKDYNQALQYANILLWHRPKLLKNIMPMLGQIAENKKQKSKLEAVLAQAPRWRYQFFRMLPTAITDARTPLTLFTSLKETAAPPTKGELRTYFNFLNRKKLYNLSYYSWLQFLPPEHLAKTGFLFNGDFDMPRDNMPFNWVIRKGKGAYSEVVTNPDNRQQKALSIKLARGHSDFRPISQIILLSAGSHIFQGRHKGELIGQRGLRWKIECLGKKRRKIAETQMFTGRKRHWEHFKISFTVPEQDCPAQYVSLTLDARTRSEKLASGHIWYDTLKIIANRTVQ